MNIIGYYAVFLTRRILIGLLSAIIFVAVFCALFLLFAMIQGFQPRANIEIVLRKDGYYLLFLLGIWMFSLIAIDLCRDWIGPKPRRINPRLLAENAKGITLQDCFRIRKFNDALDRSRYGEEA